MVWAPGCECFLAGDEVAGDAGEVVAEDRFALEQVEAIAGEAPPVRENHAFGTAFRDHDLGLDAP